MKKSEKLHLKKSTEEKIKIAAEKLFMEKGFSGTRTRDIAEAANINLALLNYYYRSKENLFNMIIMEKLDKFINLMIEILNDKSTSFAEKIDLMVNRYSDLIINDPQLPLFLMGQVQQNPDFFMEKFNVKAKIQDTTFGFENKESEIMLILDIISLIFYPFIVRSAFESLFGLSHEKYNALLNTRRQYLSHFLYELFTKFKTE